MATVEAVLRESDGYRERAGTARRARLAVVIYHLAEPSDWERARRDGAYTGSTRGRSLEEEGFIHASSPEQWPVVRRSFYGDLAEPLILLHVDEARLSSPVVHEVGNPETGETFPHVYGPIDLDAVVDTTLLEPPHV